MRIDAINPWGQVLEPQRADLWLVDLEPVIRELNQDGRLNALAGEAQQYVCAIDLPDLTIGAEAVPRDSRPYNMPSWDSPLSPIRMVFIHDVASTFTGGLTPSLVYQLLQAWRVRVRAGRGGMSSEVVPKLQANYLPPPFQFDILVQFLQGQPAFSSSGIFFGSDPQREPVLVPSAGYKLINAWLSSIKLQPASYEASALHRIDVVLYADDIIPSIPFSAWF